MGFQFRLNIIVCNKNVIGNNKQGAQIMSEESIFDFHDISSFKKASPNTKKAFAESSKLTIPNGMLGYIDMFKEVYES